MVKLADTDLAWIAGFLDGEGTISIKRMKKKDRIYYYPFVGCAQAIQREHVIRYLGDVVGGSVSVFEPRKHRKSKHFMPERQASVSWGVTCRGAEALLRKIEPYLIAKKQNAQLVLSLYDDDIGKRSATLHPEEYKRREGLFEKVRILNEKGALRLKRLSEVTPKGDATV